MHSVLLFCLQAGLLFISQAALANESTPAVSTARTAADVTNPLALSSLLQLTLGMLVVLGLIVGIAWLLKRSGRFQVAAGGGLRILGGLSMGTRERVVLLQVGETQLLLGVAPGSVKTLHILDRPIEQTHPSTTKGAGFAGQLSSLLSGEKAP